MARTERPGGASWKPAADAGKMAGVPDAPAFAMVFGRAHVALVHFPVALLLAAAGLAFWPRRDASHAAASRWCLALGLLGALAATASGLVFAWLEPPGRGLADALWWHRAVGLACTALALVAWLAARADAGPDGRVSRAALLLAALLAGVAGHLGGELVHGAGFFSAPFTRGEAPTARPAPEASAAPQPAAPSVDFATQVLPILTARCHECHGAAKVRGKLRLDAREHLFDPAREAEWVVRPGDPDGSELLRRVQLPPEDEDAMPAKGDPLTPEQVAVLRAWISQGAVWDA
jgi:uncharacterized membrane protein/mono/diheme cytochrome c family protein